MLHAAVSLIPLLSINGIIPPPTEASQLYRVDIPAGDEVPPSIRKYFTEGVALIAAQIGADFKSRLAIYSYTPNLPSGIPGDPAKDFQSDKTRGSGAFCGRFQPVLTPGSLPYAFCPLPGVIPLDPATRDCCRHFAFAVPYAKFGLAIENRVTTIVVSPRLLLLPPERWQAILAHELGHAVDFYLFGKRYRLTNSQNGIDSAELKEQLLLIDGGQEDPEVRADALGELLVLKPREQNLCYDPDLKLQTLVEASVKCSGDGGEGSKELMRHYSHPPLAGAAAIRI